MNCVTLKLEECANCSFNREIPAGLDCYIDWYYKQLAVNVILNALKFIKTAPDEKIYLFAAIRLYYPQYESRINKLAVLL